MRHLILNAVLAASCLTGLAAQTTVAGENGQYVELKDAVAVAQPGKIEVVELFSYSCRHCYTLEPVITPWVGKLPEDVAFVRVPAMFGGVWDAYGQLYLTLQAMGTGPQVHEAVFAAIQGGNRMKTPEAMAEFLGSQGVDPAKFLGTYNSFAIQAKVMDARKRTQAYKVTGVPALVVEGKYRFDLSAGGPTGMLELADRLIAQARAVR